MMSPPDEFILVIIIYPEITRNLKVAPVQEDSFVMAIAQKLNLSFRFSSGVEGLYSHLYLALVPSINKQSGGACNHARNTEVGYA